MKKGAKAAIFTVLTGGILGGVAWALNKKAKEAATATGKYKAAAAEAAGRAATAEAAARTAAAGEAAARADAAAARARADAAGRAAQGAIDSANAAIAQANNATAAARNFSAQAAQASTAAQRAALQNQANAQAQLAAQYAAKAADLRAEADRAIAEARTQAQAQVVAANTAMQQANERAAATVAQRQAEDQADAHAQAAATTQATDLEQKRLIVADAFQQLVAEVKARNPKLTQQQAINTAAAFARTQGLDLGTPDPLKAFWKQDVQQIHEQAVKTVNTYIGAGTPAKTAQPGPVATAPSTSPPPKASVQTAPNSQALLLVRQAYVDAIKYAQQKKPGIDADQGYKLIAEAFERGSQLGPGFPTVPAPSEFSAPSPYWAMSLGDIQTSLAHAIETAQHTIDLLVNTQLVSRGGKMVLIDKNTGAVLAGTMLGAAPTWPHAPQRRVRVHARAMPKHGGFFPSRTAIY